ncbi:MAG: HAMP domain-containing histidine kinase [Oscillospiraceae bacterium]|jgi:signal transduction histidine kinase|nr:HAMP domain-containing histidine kinase [Oscillospiraceae bacterium]
MVSVVLVLMNTYFLTATRDMIFSSKQALLVSQATVLETALRDIDTLTAGAVAQVMQRLDVSGHTLILVLGYDGAPLYGSADGFPQAEREQFDRNIAAALTERVDIFHSRFESGMFSSEVYFPVVRGAGITGALYIAESDGDSGSILLGLQSTVHRVTALVVLLSAVMIVIITMTLMRRISGILRAIEFVRAGEYGYRIDARGTDELALLSREFNSLTARLRETEDVRRRFVADASHELKTPLASIKLLADSITQSDDIEPDTVREFVGDIGEEANRLSRITEKLMSIARLDAEAEPVREPVDLAAAVLSAVKMLEPLAKQQRVKIETLPADGCVVPASPDEIHSVIFNLVENAIKYNFPGGGVKIVLTRAAGRVAMSVSDTGIGIPESDLPHIFDRFYRVDKARSRAAGGSGLGLAIVRGTVTRCGGTITASRREGGGTVFAAIFPEYRFTVE